MRRALPCLLLAGAVAPAAASAQDAAPAYLKRPNINDLMQVWPAKAMRRGQSGEAVIDCRVSVRGALTDCGIVSESPAGSGFGQAALALTPQFLMKPATRDGKAVEGTMRIPIAFIAGGPGPGRGQMRKVASKVPWLAAPTYAEMRAAFPAKAQEAGVGGAVVLTCEFIGDGRVKACRTTNEAPFGMGFGGAARNLADRFVGPAAFVDGTPTKGAKTQIRFTFPAEMATSVDPVVGKPDWAALPTAEQLQSAIPPGALAAGIESARVVLACRVAPDGGLEACKVEGEEPAGHGFGASTLNLAQAFRMTIWTDDGLPSIGAKVRIPIRYAVKAVAP